jgi:hypothetical protein
MKDWNPPLTFGVMMLLVKVDGIEGAIVGYAPEQGGTPLAIVLMEGSLHPVKLHDIEVLSGPRNYVRKKISKKKGEEETASGLYYSILCMTRKRDAILLS